MTNEISTEIAEIHDTLRSDRSSYDADAGMQSRLRELYEARDTGVVPSPRQAGSELAEIQKVMKTDINRYWRDSAMQERYRQLLEAQEGAVQSPAARRNEALDGFAPIRSPSEWKAAGNDPASYPVHAQLVREVNDILMAVDDGARVAVGDSFAALPVSVHSAAFAMLCDRRAVAADPFHEADMQRLAQVPAYRALAREWGQDAPRKMAVLQERIWRVIDRLGDADTRRAIDWLNNISTSGMIAIGRKLAR